MDQNRRHVAVIAMFAAGALVSCADDVDPPGDSTSVTTRRPDDSASTTTSTQLEIPPSTTSFPLSTPRSNPPGPPLGPGDPDDFEPDPSLPVQSSSTTDDR